MTLPPPPADADPDAGLLSPVRAGTPVEAVVGDRAWLQAMLDAEAALARAQARLGTVPGAAAAAITAAARADRIDLRRLAVRARETANPVVGLVEALTAVVAAADPAAAGYVHQGSTSQDIFDTAAMLVAGRALRLVRADLTRTADALALLAGRHRDTVMAGRTLALHAVPTTFGLKAAGWRSLVLDAADRVDRLVRDGLPVSLGGAAGTLAGYLVHADARARAGDGEEGGTGSGVAPYAPGGTPVGAASGTDSGVGFGSCPEAHASTGGGTEGATPAGPAPGPYPDAHASAGGGAEGATSAGAALGPGPYRDAHGGPSPDPHSTTEGVSPAGTAIGPGAYADALVDAFAAETGLARPGLPWHALRTPIADLAAALSFTAAALGKIAVDVQTLARTEIGELAEPGPAGRGGSSAMPHKRNPVLATLIRSAALQVPVLAAGLTQCVSVEDERSAGGWHAEWQLLRECLRLTGGAAHTAVELAEGLGVRTDRMRGNLALTGGRIVSERVAAVLGGTLGKAAARRLLTEAAAAAESSGRPLSAVLAEAPELAGVLSPEELAGLCDPDHYTGAAGALVDRALEERVRGAGRS